MKIIRKTTMKIQKWKIKQIWKYTKKWIKYINRKTKDERNRKIEKKKKKRKIEK